MSGEYEIELSEPTSSRCECCGGLTVRLTRFVYRDGDAFAVYYACWSNNHPDAELALLVSLGPWGEGSDPAHRAAFSCLVRATDEAYEVMLGDAANSAWAQSRIMGQMLSREQALAHPLKATAFEVLDQAFGSDPFLDGFLQRVRCGDPAVPLERTFRAPDVIHQLGDVQADRVELGRSFARLDGERCFVRCLLPIPVEEYGHWSVGVWVEVSSADFERCRTAWDDPQLYAQLRFSGTLANDVEADLELAAPIGAEVVVEVPDPEAVPRIGAASPGPLSALLTRPWPKLTFEAYAVSRGFL